MKMELDKEDASFLTRYGITVGEYPAEKGTLSSDFEFPSKKDDFSVKISEEDGRIYVEFPDSIKAAHNGRVLDLVAGEDISSTLAGKVVASFV